ncbi:Cathepsin B [Halotydeus destructor]|nr:Cathepsin B [Halotydeus destructor]
MIDEVRLRKPHWKPGWNKIMTHDLKKIKKMLGTIMDESSALPLKLDTSMGGMGMVGMEPNATTPNATVGAVPLSANQTTSPTVLSQPMPTFQLPDNFDARLRWPQCPCIGRIFNQGYCGSCWAMSASQAMTDRECIWGKGNKRRSAIQLTSCAAEGQYGCGGGYTHYAWSAWQTQGVVSGDFYPDEGGCMPYTIPPFEANMAMDMGTPACLRQCQTGYGYTSDRDRTFGKSCYKVASRESSIMKEIFNHGTVTMCHVVYADFMSYTSGMFALKRWSLCLTNYDFSGVYSQTCDDSLGGHAVCAIGWGIENGVKYWLCKNSWGTDWGDKGFYKILRGVNECGCEGKVEAGLPA